jgi:hypothetical protein
MELATSYPPGIGAIRAFDGLSPHQDRMLNMKTKEIKTTSN